MSARVAILTTSLLVLLGGIRCASMANGISKHQLLTISVMAQDSVELVDGRGRRDGYRDGEPVAEIPYCTRNVYYGEPRVGDDADSSATPSEGDESTHTLFELDAPPDGELRVLLHGSIGGDVILNTQGSGRNGKVCGMSADDSVGGGMHEWRVTIKAGCATKITKAQTPRKGRATSAKP